MTATNMCQISVVNGIVTPLGTFSITFDTVVSRASPFNLSKGFFRGDYLRACPIQPNGSTLLLSTNKGKILR